MSYGYDTHIRDAAGKSLVSYGPRRIEIERVVDGKSYVSYQQHHPEHDDPGAHIEACTPEQAAFWGVYQHDDEGLAAIVGDAHDEESAKAFAQLVARNLTLERGLAVAANVSAHLAVGQRRDEVASRALRIQQGMPRYTVDGHEFRDEDSAFTGDGKYPPFVVFDVDRQENLPGEYGTRSEADHAATIKNAQMSRSVVLAIDTNSTAFKDVGPAYEVARLLRDAGAQLEEARDLESIRLVDINGNEVGWLYVADRPAELALELALPGMIHLVVDAGADPAFGTTEADRAALARTFQGLGDQLDGVRDLANRMAAFTVEVQDGSSLRNSQIAEVRIGHFFYTPAPEPEVHPSVREAAVAEI